ncbi:MAG TPA: polysaccharide biosynthesis/export family protein [Candidatus Eisenbacteria bacterium]|jgi:polysaccharide export outer membrane protein|nr:polysaccharide biosynthesis/export family protein [Candidatus Eisenbacteria bacterium]
MLPLLSGWVISRRIGAVSLLLALAAASPALAANTKPPAGPTIPDSAFTRPTAADSVSYFVEPYPYRIAPGDQLFIDYGVFLEGHEITATVLVRPDGMMNLPYVGEVRASGQSTVEMDSTLARLYSRIYVNARITTSLSQIAGNLVYVMGEVQRPGSYPMQPNTSILGAVAQAGGFTKDAASGDILVVRRAGPSTVGVKRVNLKHFLQHRRGNPDIVLRRSDIVYVNRTAIADINLFVEQMVRPILSIGDAYAKAWTIVNIDRVFPEQTQSSLKP